MGKYRFSLFSYDVEDTYGRFIGDLDFSEGNGLDFPISMLTYWLLEKGLARRMGTHREPWSEIQLNEVVEKAKLICTEFAIPDVVPLFKVNSSPMKLSVSSQVDDQFPG
jgi:hypothetical protein